MSNCKCNSCSSSNFSQRSETIISNEDRDLSEFLLSQDYKTFSENFTSSIIDGEQRLVTFNNTTIQGLWLPTILESGEKQALFTYYKMGTNPYLTFVANSKGDFKNLLDMSGAWDLFLPDSSTLLTCTFEHSEWTSISYGKVAGKRSIARCMYETVRDMGLGTAITCAADIEMCLLAVGIDCAYEHLVN